MGLMGNLRNRAGLVILVIGLAIVAFLLGDIFRSGMPFLAQKQNEVGNINGNAIDYQNFNAQVDQTSQMYQQQMGGVETPQIRNYAVQQVWNQFISNNLIKSELDKLGLTIGTKELNDLVQGPNPSAQIMQTFVNPQTGQFDRQYLAQVITESKNNPEIANQWNALLEQVQTQRLAEKYGNLVSSSVYVTALEAQDEYTSKNKLANFKYVLLDYASVNENDIKLTDADYKEYYDKYKNSFKNEEETRTIDYVLIDANPVASDSAMTLSTIEKLKSELTTSTNDSLFVSINSDNKFPVKYYKKGELGSEALENELFNAANGAVVGPFLGNGAYEIAKVISSKTSPDSVKLSHILLDAAAEGGIPKAKAKADSIKGLIAKGEKFSTLAIEFSKDPNSKVNGGELGTIAMGQIGGAIEDAAFGGKTGDVVVVESQAGVHVLKIDNQIGNSKVVKAAVVDKAIVAGKQTTENAYAKANNFFKEATSANFDDVAKKQNLNLAKSARLRGMDNTVNGVEIPRELVRWVFDNKAGQITDKVFETETHFIVAKVTNINPKGVQPLEAIKSEIQVGVKNLVKARMLKEKLNNALNGASSIDQVAQKVGKSAIAVENIVLANPVIPGVSLESTVIGTVFGLQPNKPSKAIEGSQGVYAVQVSSFVNPKEMVDSERKAQQKQILAAKQQRAWGSIFRALQNNADIDDNRIRFY